MDMLDLLRILLCGFGLVFLAFRFRDFVRSVSQGYNALSAEANAPSEDVTHPPDRAPEETAAELECEQVTFSSTRLSD